MRPDLPTGTVTFLFTDVEGSTKLLHELGAETYAEALAEHRRLIREACAHHGGVEVDTQGDAFFFAFPTAPGALAAAAAFTERLELGPIRVRVGLHTGTPLVTGEGYVGDDVHVAARIVASSHGGQVVLSQATRELLDDDFSLSDLGEHRLKDIEGPVSIFQLGERSFPPLKTISNTNLPRPASSFVGRDEELQEVLSRIEGGARLVTLTGPGGTGKTRLALEVATTLVPEYKAGVFWVGLASLRVPALVTETIAQTLGAKDSLAEHIHERELLLLLDNLEQVIESAPELASLLSACPNLTLLVTSRELLRVSGEVEYPVPPLAEPEAVGLFCERSQLEPSHDIAELCARLDSLPLAVELAAARTKALSPAQILERLSQRLDLLKGGRDADPRQQTLRATTEWSYDLLSAEEQQLFARLSVFAGGCTLKAAEDVAQADLDTLQSLVEKSLLRFTDERYWMLETIREYAAEQLVESGSVGEWRSEHADFMLGWTTRAADELYVSDGAAATIAFGREQNNLRAALTWLLDSGDFEALLLLVRHAAHFWEIRGEWAEGRRWATVALDHGVDPPSRARVLNMAGTFARHGRSWDLARAYQLESLSIFRSLGDLNPTVSVLGGLSNIAAELGDNAEAERWLEEAMSVARECGSERLIAMCTGNLADLAVRRGDDARGLELAAAAVDEYRGLGWGPGLAWSLYLQALCLMRLGQDQESARLAREALRLAHESGDAETLAWLFVLSGATVARQGLADDGAVLVGLADALGEKLDLTLTGAEAELLGETTTALRQALGDDAFEISASRGHTMSTEDGVAFAVASLD